MLEFKAQDLCQSSSGCKIHIKKNTNFTYCGGEASNPYQGQISLTEEAKELCQNCLREYRKRKGR